jgi:hypothetical protein
MNYEKIYNSIITHAKQRGNCSMSKRNTLTGHEKHHVIPVSAGGTNTSVNLVFLTQREHFICHILLVKFSKPEHLKSLRYALGMMRSRGKIVSSHSYEFAREQYRLAHIQTRTGSKQSEETKQKISAAHKGKKRSAEHCEATRVAQLGKKLSEEHKKKLSIANKGKSKPMTEEHKLAMRGKRGPWTEKQREARKLCAEKIRQAHLGSKRSQETKDKISESRKRNKHRAQIDLSV